MRHTQTITLRITYDPFSSEQPAQWDWEDLCDLNTAKGESVVVEGFSEDLDITREG